MERDGRDDGRRHRQPALAIRTEDPGVGSSTSDDSDIVFDFTGLHRPDVRDLSMVLTARLQASPEERVWVRALPLGTWKVLGALGLDHLFHVYPGPGALKH